MSAATAEVLRKARALVAKGWTQGTLATRLDGGAVRPTDPAAVCWCGEGAVEAQVPVGGVSWEAAIGALRVAAGAGSFCFAFWQDTPGRTQAEVLEAFDRAIATEEASP